ncbi:hypothetical protein QR98_0067090 [Sarcoptes scabiei]|uniref:Uncharacterized protein n=1 Tax=Sarcoptes scabiei TaxID=52283 RepID=A0A132AC98_SARSC|nr:hypothetical protein QR98_0067090 [Sarcoptes scabiei]
MSFFREANNHIKDVPMKFSDRYLNLLQRSTFHDDPSNDINLDQFKIKDYKFDNELIAIEMFELQSKKMQARKMNHSKPKSTSDDKNLTMIPHISNPMNGDRQMQFKQASPFSVYNLMPGEILKPQILENNSAITPSSCFVIKASKETFDISKTNCDNVDSLEHANAPIPSSSSTSSVIVNPQDFENDSSPFDNVELQTIDDIKELNKVFGVLNLGLDKNCTVPRNSPVNHNYASFNEIDPASFTNNIGNNI